MKAFTYQRVRTPAEAATAAAQHPGARFIAGGTNLLDLMKLEIETPPHLVDVNGLGLDRIAPAQDGGLRVGALVRNTDLAAQPLLSPAELRERMSGNICRCGAYSNIIDAITEVAGVKGAA